MGAVRCESLFDVALPLTDTKCCAPRLGMCAASCHRNIVDYFEPG